MRITRILAAALPLTLLLAAPAMATPPKKSSSSTDSGSSICSQANSVIKTVGAPKIDCGDKSSDKSKAKGSKDATDPKSKSSTSKKPGN